MVVQNKDLNSVFTDLAAVLGKQRSVIPESQVLRVAQRAFDSLPASNETHRRNAINIAKALSHSAGMPTRIKLSDANKEIAINELLEQSRDLSRESAISIIEDLIEPRNWLKPSTGPSFRFDPEVDGGTMVENGTEYHIRKRVGYSQKARNDGMTIGLDMEDNLLHLQTFLGTDIVGRNPKLRDSISLKNLAGDSQLYKLIRKRLSLIDKFVEARKESGSSPPVYRRRAA